MFIHSTSKRIFLVNKFQPEMRLLITIMLKDKAVLLLKSNVEESEAANSIIIIKCLHCIDYQTK